MIRPLPDEYASDSLLLDRVCISDSHVCAAPFDGGVQCWGSMSSKVPALFAAHSGAPIASVSCGRQHTCVLVSSGTAATQTLPGQLPDEHLEVVCWGSDQHGQTSSAEAVMAEADDADGGVGGFASLCSGWYFSCGLLRGGAMRCWGEAPPGAGAASSAGRYAAISCGAFAVCAIEAGARAGTSPLPPPAYTHTVHGAGPTAAALWRSEVGQE